MDVFAGQRMQTISSIAKNSQDSMPAPMKTEDLKIHLAMQKAEEIKKQQEAFQAQLEQERAV